MSLVDKIIPENWNGARNTFVKFALTSAMLISTPMGSHGESIDSKVLEGLQRTPGSYELIDNKSEEFSYGGSEFIRPKYDDGFERILTLALGLGEKSFKFNLSSKDDRQERIIDYFNQVGSTLNKLNPNLMKKDLTGMRHLSYVMAVQIEGSKTLEGGKKNYSFEIFNENCNQYNRFFAPIRSYINAGNLSDKQKNDLTEKYASEIIDNLTPSYDVNAAFRYIDGMSRK